MDMKVFAAALCLILAVFAVPAAAYFIEGEDILTSPDWSEPPNTSGEVSSVERYNVVDPNASGGSALEVFDELAPDSDSGITSDMGKFFYKTNSSVPFNGSATAVARIRTGEGTFAGKVNRTLILSFTSKPGDTARRAVGLNIFPDMATITNTTGSSTYATIMGDNTSYVIWTIVARDYGYWYDIYRNGVHVFSNTTANPSSSEGVIGAVDALTIASSPSASKGTWVYDWVAFREGEHPTWNPVPEPGSLAVLGGALAGTFGMVFRRRKS